MQNLLYNNRAGFLGLVNFFLFFILFILVLDVLPHFPSVEVLEQSVGSLVKSPLKQHHPEHDAEGEGGGAAEHGAVHSVQQGHGDSLQQEEPPSVTR